MLASKKKVLVVEDEFILYDEIREFFLEKGFDVIQFEDERAVDSFDAAVELLHSQAADIAVLDIRLKGKKDGIELGAYIKQHYNTPVIYLTAFDNEENLGRAKLLRANGFVVKATKPFDRKQLWATVSMVLPDVEQTLIEKTIGSFFKVKEIDISAMRKKNNAADKRPADPVDLETFVKWEEIKFVESLNAKSGMGNNNILFHTLHPNKGYVNRNTLAEIETILPDHFTRFSQAYIVNLNFITHKGTSEYTYYIKDERFDISDTYKKSAMQKIKLYLGNKF